MMGHSAPARRKIITSIPLVKIRNISNGNPVVFFTTFFLNFFGAKVVFEVKHLGYEAGDNLFFDAKKMALGGRSMTWTGEDVFSSQPH